MSSPTRSVERFFFLPINFAVMQGSEHIPLKMQEVGVAPLRFFAGQVLDFPHFIST